MLTVVYAKYETFEHLDELGVGKILGVPQGRLDFLEGISNYTLNFSHYWFFNGFKQKFIFLSAPSTFPIAKESSI